MADELRRRWSRTVVTALGLAAGVGLVIGIIGVSNGLTDAQNQVLSPLSSVGTGHHPHPHRRGNDPVGDADHDHHNH